MFKLFLQILRDECGTTLAITRKTANTLISASGFNTNYDEIEAVVNALTSANLADGSVLAAAFGADVVRANYGLIKHSDGSLYVDVSDTTPALELTDGGLRVKAYGLNQRTANGLEVGRAGDLLLSSAASVPDGWSDVSATYEGKFMRISATALSTGTGLGATDSHTLTVAEMPSHAHTVAVYSSQAGNVFVSYASTTSQGNVSTSSTGGGEGHTHIITAYVPAFVSSKMFMKN